MGYEALFLKPSCDMLLTSVQATLAIHTKDGLNKVLLLKKLASILIASCIFRSTSTIIDNEDLTY